MGRRAKSVNKGRTTTRSMTVLTHLSILSIDTEDFGPSDYVSVCRASNSGQVESKKSMGRRAETVNKGRTTTRSTTGLTLVTSVRIIKKYTYIKIYTCLRKLSEIVFYYFTLTNIGFLDGFRVRFRYSA